VVALNDEARREAYLLQQEYESKLLEVSRLEPELERERARLQQQWEHLRSMVDEREGRKESLKQFRQSLEQAREEAHAALEEARKRGREKEARERELEQRIEELEISQAEGFEAQQKLEKLTAHLQELRSLPRRETHGAEPVDVGTGVAAANGQQDELEKQISELESEKRSAELALERIASRSARGPGPERSLSAAARLPEPPKLKAWQFVAHKRRSGSPPS
jgi:chromosome segregation ATPase